MRCVVTGGAGFLGSHLVDQLILNGHSVAVIDDLSGGNLDNLNLNTGGNITFFSADCRDEKKMDSFFKDFKPEVVFHLAANAAENKAQFSPIDITSRNYDAFIKVLTPFIKYGGKRFVFTSSIAVYGSLQTPFKETDKPEPEDLYGISKLAAEQTIKVMSQVHEFEYVIARPHNVYGPRQNMTDPYRNVMTIWMNKVLNNEPIPIYGDGEQVRCFSYIYDVVDALYKCGFEDVDGKTFNIGSDNQYTLNKLATYISDNVTHLPDRPQEVKVAVSDHTQCKEILGYHETLLDHGIRETWEYVEQTGYQEPIYTELEIDSPKVPANWRKK